MAAIRRDEMISYRLIFAPLFLCGQITVSTAAQADESVVFHVATAMAEADYRRSIPCKWWAVDEPAVKKLVKRSGQGLAELRASEGYADQKAAIAWVVKQYGHDALCENSGLFDVEENEYGVLRRR